MQPLETKGRQLLNCVDIMGCIQSCASVQGMSSCCAKGAIFKNRILRHGGGGRDGVSSGCSRNLWVFPPSAKRMTT